jgi:hypothetical protein
MEGPKLEWQFLSVADALEFHFSWKWIFKTTVFCQLFKSVSVFYTEISIFYTFETFSNTVAVTLLVTVNTKVYCRPCKLLSYKIQYAQMWSSVLWRCSLVWQYQHFRGTCLHIRRWSFKNWPFYCSLFFSCRVFISTPPHKDMNSYLPCNLRIWPN